ncbi:hypothetical protein BC830DRAFT_1131524 [Chytriomyces sp. MP71]|nr:hypothetical protein BC830DRAFT_1131524 [Chytriomyces sp. MP71]
MSAAATGRAPPVGLREFGGGDEEAGRKASEGTVSAVPGLSGLAMSASASGAVSVGDAAATEGAGSSSSSSQSQSIAIRNHHNHYNQQHQHHHNRKNSFASLSPSLPPHAGGSVAASSFRRARALLDNLSRSIVSNNGFSSPLLGPNVSTASLAKSVSRSLGKSWTREAFLE